jgi:non-heme chloroperoxidase
MQSIHSETLPNVTGKQVSDPMDAGTTGSGRPTLVDEKIPETILMIHGMWGGGWCWRKYKGHFERSGYCCVTPTLRHHDVNPREAPPPHLATTSLLDYAEDLILMGHSMGGLLAQILASRGCAKAIVLLTPGAPYGIFSLKPSVIKSFRSGLFRWRFWRKAYRQTFDEATYSMFNNMPVETHEKLYSRFVAESGKAATEIGFWFFDTNSAARVDDSRVTCPVLIIGARQDRITPVAVTRKIAAKYHSVATYTEFPRHGHWVIGEPGWQEIAKYIDLWLKHSVSLETKMSRSAS